MIISFSHIRQFGKCQRQWSFKTFGEPRSDKNPFRRELYLLSTLQSVYAWRGNLVDHVITVRIISALKNGWTLDENSIINFARSLFDKQLAFARAHHLRDSGMTVTGAGEELAALAAIEYAKT